MCVLCSLFAACGKLFISPICQYFIVSRLKNGWTFDLNLATVVNRIDFKCGAITDGATRMNELSAVAPSAAPQVWQCLCLVEGWARADHPHIVLSTCNLASITHTRHTPLSNPLIHRITTNSFFCFHRRFYWSVHRASIFNLFVYWHRIWTD